LFHGLEILGINCVVGGFFPGASNIVSGNKQTGIFVQNSNCTVQGNIVGASKNQSILIPNLSDGIEVSGENAIVGGYNPGEGNRILSSGRLGLLILMPNSTVVGNIFVNCRSNGVECDSPNRIFEENTIQNNSKSGIVLVTLKRPFFMFNNSISNHSGWPIWNSDIPNLVTPPEILFASMETVLLSLFVPANTTEFSVDLYGNPPNETNSLDEAKFFLRRITQTNNGTISHVTTIAVPDMNISLSKIAYVTAQVTLKRL
jgi:parallel beta-helix repeat protein